MSKGYPPGGGNYNVLTLPAQISNLAVKTYSERIDVQCEVPDDPDATECWVTYKAGGVAEHPFDPDCKHVVTPLVTPEIDAGTRLLLHMDDMTDSSPTPKELYPTDGDVAFEPVVGAYGSAAARFKGTSYLTLDRSNDWAFPGDFTVDFRIYPLAWGGTTTNYNGLFVVIGTGGLVISREPSGLFGISQHGSAAFLTCAAPPLNEWTHVAVCRSGTAVRIFYNGKLQAQAESDLNFVPSSAAVGGDGQGSYFNGYMDELRVSGVCRWTSDFDPPVVPYGSREPVKVSMTDGVVNDTEYGVRVFIRGRMGFQTALKGASAMVTPKGHKIYGIRIDKNDPNPYTRIAYTNDAEGFTPLSIDFSTHITNLGSWAEFINEFFAPVMLNFNGTEAYELDREDQTKKADGTASDVSNFSFAGDAMVRIKTLWIKLWGDDSYNYCNIATAKVDDSYQAYAFTNESGNVQDRIYVAMYRGRYDSSNKRWRSIAGQSIYYTSSSSPMTISDCITNSNDKGVYPISYGQYVLISMVLVMLAKSTNCQAVYGNGNTKNPNGGTSSGKAGTILTGGTKSSGPFYGYSNTADKNVKTLWIEDYWGQQVCLLAGCWYKYSNQLRFKEIPPYQTTESACSEANGYRIVTSLTGGSPQNMKFGIWGFYPLLGGGSSSTYWCDRAGGYSVSKPGGFGGYAYNNGTFSVGIGDDAGPFAIAPMDTDDNKIGGNLGLRIAYVKRG